MWVWKFNTQKFLKLQMNVYDFQQISDKKSTLSCTRFLVRYCCSSDYCKCSGINVRQIGKRNNETESFYPVQLLVWSICCKASVVYTHVTTHAKFSETSIGVKSVFVHRWSNIRLQHCSSMLCFVGDVSFHSKRCQLELVDQALLGRFIFWYKTTTCLQISFSLNWIAVMLLIKMLSWFQCWCRNYITEIFKLFANSFAVQAQKIVSQLSSVIHLLLTIYWSDY